jgi:ubiquinone/menaquinone biosynthesis C-methylase UbiE
MPPTRDERKQLVADGYDRMSDRYAAWAAQIEGDPRDRMITELTRRLPLGGRLLDLGCGSGVPSTKVLAEQFEVVGVDFSTAQIERARVNVPTAEFLVADLTEFEFPDASFDAVTAFYALDHVPREQHRALFSRVARWLVPDGLFLASTGHKDEADWTGEWLGVPTYFSSHAPDVTRRLLADAGFELEIDEIVEIVEPEGAESFLWILAREAGPLSPARTVRGDESRTDASPGC